MKTTSLRLAKQNFKFSSAHFLIFDQKSAEMLHGHNYQVVVSILAPDVGNDSDDDGKMGYMVDFNVLKKFIKARLDVWDEHVLLPKNHPDMKCISSSNNKNYEVTFRDRFYSFPKEEVIWLNCSNTSVEQLSSILAEEFFKEFNKYGIAKLTVAVEETRGQSAATTIE
ncbi:MAG: 6-carboxytetrahydropterin synthase [Pseudobdellovibrio sp.]|nr:6-carboxytetrahydropterin synthase [Pseudobdellovibrio sp.]